MDIKRMKGPPTVAGRYLYAGKTRELPLAGHVKVFSDGDIEFLPEGGCWCSVSLLPGEWWEITGNEQPPDNGFLF